MSAYASLESLRRIMGSGGLWSIDNRAQLRSLHEKVVFFLDFLDNSSAYGAAQASALEVRMREAAYKAEDLIESQVSGILHSGSRRFRVLMIMTLINFFYSFVVVSNKIHPSFPETPETLPGWIEIFAFRFLIPALAAVAVSAILAFVLNLALEGSDFSENYGSREQKAQDFRVLLYDLDFVAKEAIRIKEASGELEIEELPDSASLVSLRKVLDSVLDSSGGGLRVCHNRAQLRSLHEKVTFLLDFLENASAYNYVASRKPVEATIKDAVHKAQQLVEFQIPAQFVLDSDRKSRKSFFKFMKFLLLASVSSISAAAMLTVTSVSAQLSWVTVVAVAFGTLAFGMRRAGISKAIDDYEMQENHELSLIIDELGVVVEEVNMMIKVACGDPCTLTAASSSSSFRMDWGGTGKNVVVGLERDMEQIKARLLQDSSKLEVISIVGMGGIGKTTLAAQVYADLGIASFFDVRAWVTISQDYSLRHVLLGLLDSAKIPTEGKREDSVDKLALCLYQYLMFRRYLIVVDDVWDTGIWNFLSRFFPDNCNQSRVLLTSRLSDVASYPDSLSPLHQMKCLNEDKSWQLLCEKVFGVEVCPSELDSIGREIARSCRGLPLAILVIGGLLCKDKQDKIWREVAENLNRILMQTEEQCLEILGLSYSHLPHHLRPCFLYMGVFVGDSEIHVSRLISLWAAEGFLKPCPTKSLEEVAEGYLKDLIDRNLILVSKLSCNGKIRTCSIHDLLRDVCVETARKENFFLVTDGVERLEPSARRISVRLDDRQAQGDIWHESISSCHYVRSFLCSAGKLLNNQSSFYLGFLYLRVLDVLVVHFGEFPYQIIKLFHLRYLAFHCDRPLPSSISKLHNLETIYHHHCSSLKSPLLLGVIWSMPNLRHLYVKPGCYLSGPLRYRISWKSSVLEHLQTLVGIRNFKWSKDIIGRIPNLKKLGISYDVPSSVDWSTYQFDTLADLHQLEALKIIIKYDGAGSGVRPNPPELAFPQKLKKLSLSGCRLPWEGMSAISELPNLEALKLRCEAFSGLSWETSEEEFPRLMFLLLEEMSFMTWETEESHFPRLQRLVMRSCSKLDEIPCAVGDFPMLEVMELDDCLPSVAASAKQIQEEQRSMGKEVVVKFRIEPEPWLITESITQI